MSERIRHTYTSEFEINPHRGLFVAFEGLDGSGQTTQAEMLARYFQENGIRSWLTKEPTDGPAGGQIRLALSRALSVDHQTLQMFFSTDRSDHLINERGITERLKKGWGVVSDRYLKSTLAYGYAAGLDVDWLIAVQSKFILPDMTFYLNIPVSVTLQRMKETRIGFDLYETEELLTKTKKGYEIAISKFPGTVEVLDGTASPQEINKLVIERIMAHSKFPHLLRGNSSQT